MTKTKGNKQEVLIAKEVGELEKRMDYIRKNIEEHTNGVKADKNQLMSKIHEMEEMAEHKKSDIAGKWFRNISESNIYDVDNIDKATDKESCEELNKRIDMYYQTYAVSPYKDKKHAKEALDLLDELEEIVKQLDLYYEDNFNRAKTNLKNAIAAHIKSIEAREEYRRAVKYALDPIGEAVRYTTIWSNELVKHGGFSMPTSIMYNLNLKETGAEMCDSIKHAILCDQKEAEDDRKRTGLIG